MRARDVIGRRIVEVRQRRVSTRVSADGVTELESAWEIVGFRLDNGKWLTVTAIETDAEPVVTARVFTPPTSRGSA